MTHTFVIVGAGEAGIAAAAAMRESGFTGNIVIFGQEPALPYARPPLSKTVLTSAAEPTPIRQRSWFDERHITLCLAARVDHVDPVNRRVMIVSAGEQRTQCYDRLLFSTGARARTLTGTGFAGVEYLRTDTDALSLRRRLISSSSMIVIGGGVIGLEAASGATELGVIPRVIEAAPRLMARSLTDELSTVMLDWHRRAGVDIRLGAAIAGVVPLPEARMRLLLASGEAIDGDLILAGIGAQPNDTIAAMAGCAVGDGILVDDLGRTSVAAIFAAGDVARLCREDGGSQRIETWQHAVRHGAHVGRAMAGAATPYAEIPWFWTDQHGHNLQVAGDVRDVERTVWHHGTGGRTGLHFRGGVVVGATTIDNGRDMRAAKSLIERRWRGEPGRFGDASRPFRQLVEAALAGA